MTKAYQAIQTITVGAGGQSSIEFVNIPQNYNDLVIKISGRSSTTTGNITLAFNNSTSNFSWRRLLGDGSSPSTFSASDNYGGLINLSSYTADTFGNYEIYIPNYAGSANKSFSIDAVTENNATGAIMALVAGLWSNTAAISSVKFTSDTLFVQHSTATLYGIGGARATGGTITADGEYTYHTFTSSGTFVPLENIKNAEALVIAGGGGGGGGQGGGGGAGGYISTSMPQMISATNYSVVVGSGGSGGVFDSGKGSNGSDSAFYNLLAFGGGGGGSYSSSEGRNGGSGGGAGASPSLSSGGSQVIGQGTPGGFVYSYESPYRGGGGGGASMEGSPGSPSDGVGGDGTIFSISGDNVARCGGGGAAGEQTNSGAAGGLGGGGNGGNPGTAGTANTGGGGGGSTYVGGAAGRSGGSGIVVIRYPNT